MPTHMHKHTQARKLNTHTHTHMHTQTLSILNQIVVCMSNSWSSLCFGRSRQDMAPMPACGAQGLTEGLGLYPIAVTTPHVFGGAEGWMLTLVTSLMPTLPEFKATH